MNESYLSSIKKLFNYYKSLGDGAISQLRDDEINFRKDSHQNSIAIIIGHMSGNMLSRWTGFPLEDGEKDFRNRDQEFETDNPTIEQAKATWEKGWKVCLDAINSLEKDQMGDITYIRNEGHTIAEAINRQLGHYAYHVGQIVAMTKTFRGAEWQSLSIPKNGSKAFNAEKFGKEKKRKFFTEK